MSEREEKEGGRETLRRHTRPYQGRVISPNETAKLDFDSPICFTPKSSQLPLPSSKIFLSSVRNEKKSNDGEAAFFKSGSGVLLRNIW